MARADAALTTLWKPLARMRTHEQVVAEIEHRLMTGVLKAGDRLPAERQFAEALGVSRGAVREALRILEAIGVVEAGTGSGPSSGSMIVKDSATGIAMVLRLHLQVASFTPDDLAEVRLLIEWLAARKVADLATDEEIIELRCVVDRMHKTTDVTEFDDLEQEFHRRIIEAADNALVKVLIGAVRATELPGGTTIPAEPDTAEEAARWLADEYSAVVAAIIDGDGDRVAELLANVSRSGRCPTSASALKWGG